MSWLVWNIRGTNKRLKQKELVTFIKENNVKLVGLVETRVKKNNVAFITDRIAPGWQAEYNYDYAVNGRLWVLWDTNVYEVTPLAKEAQYIHCAVKGKQIKVECHMTVVYGYNTVELRKPLWTHHQTLSGNTPWIIWGDFNAILTSQDKLNGASVTSHDIKDFADCVQALNINELMWIGEYYTWSNKQRGANRVYNRIDRAFGNDEWMLQYGQLDVDYGLPHISDHAPMIITLKDDEPCIKIPFKFFNVWADHDQFLTLVDEAWEGRVALEAMKNINKVEFKDTTGKIVQARIELQDVQTKLVSHYSDQLVNDEKAILEKLEKWSMIEESILQQKSRATWVKLGDSNSKYFSAVTKERKHKKTISMLTALDGTLLTDKRQIQEEIVAFYRSLMGTS
ncbi:uncharacterized protein LOC132620191 [Lycium barbarum]|uniref:uncharacterized protein LOC132620191 n=1 Tax=Lycium barbarum TaxID=112863 RepID=UPI00293EB836|nr:uncharacterized protein LOC132620191 [Lycium barbarum]